MIRVSAWSAPRRPAPAAARISATYSRTARPRKPASAGVSTPPRSTSAPRKETATTVDPLLAAFLLVPAGFIAGALNTVAGGGSFLTLPLLIVLGLPHDVANGTNRLAILIQTAGAAATFRRAGAFPVPVLLRLGLAAALGAGFGSAVALEVGEAVFLRFLSIVMVLFTLFPLLRRRAEPGIPATNSPTAGAGLFAAFLMVGFYGGFVQAGVGFLSLGATSWAGFSLLAGNTIKVACIFLFSVISLTIFAANGVVDWRVGLALGAGTLAGALVGARWTLRAGDRVLRLVVAAATLTFAVLVWLRA